MLVDTHVHLVHEAFDEDRDEVIRQARESGVTELICVGDRLDTSAAGIRLADTYPNLWASAGIHPHHAATVDEGWEEALTQMASHPRVIGIGEVGLDYFYDFVPGSVQRDIFRRQIRLARQADLPLIIHSRESVDDIIRLLKEEHAQDIGGVLHCFWGNLDQAHQALDLGFYLGVGGPVTFKKSEDLRRMIKNLPLERLLVETDAPYLAPVPHRGRRNVPAHTRVTAEYVAALKSIEFAELAAATRHNTQQLFGIP